jgi:hypothetical protein
MKSKLQFLGAPTCKCADRVQELLEANNLELERDLLSGRVILSTVKANGRPGKSIIASHCPFCGGKYEELGP